MPAVDGGEDQRMHLAAPPIVGVGEHPQVAEIDLAFHPGIPIADPHSGVLATETTTLTGESVQRAIRHRAALAGQQSVDLGDRQRPLLTVASHPRGDLLLEPRQLFPRRAMAIRAYWAHRLGHRPDQPVINGLDAVATAQTGRLRGLDVAAHRLAVHAAMRGDRAVARCR